MILIIYCLVYYLYLKNLKRNLKKKNESNYSKVSIQKKLRKIENFEIIFDVINVS